MSSAFKNYADSFNAWQDLNSYPMGDSILQRVGGMNYCAEKIDTDTMSIAFLQLLPSI